MDTGSATHDAGTAQDPAAMTELRSGKTVHSFAPGSPMAKKLRKKEKEMLAAWPAATQEHPDEIPPTEARPTALDFESTHVREENTHGDTTHEKREDENRRRQAARDEKLREMRNIGERKEMPQRFHDRPSYLRTATSSNTLSTETITEAVLGQYECPPQLTNAAKNINSFHDRIAWYKDKYPKSQETISPSHNSETWRDEFGTYYSEFWSRNKKVHEAAAVALIERMSNISEAAKLVLQRALIFGVGMSGDELKEAAKTLRDTGTMGDRQATVSDLIDLDFDGLANLAVEALCYSGSGCDSTDSTLTNLSKINISRCNSAAEMLATELTYWNACMRELTVAPYCIYVRMKNLKGACERHLPAVAAAFDDIDSRNKEVKLSRINSWKRIEDLFIEAWDLAKNQHPDLLRDQIDTDSSLSDGDNDGKPSAHPAGLSASEQEIIEAKVEEFALGASDDTLKCYMCKKDFTDTVADQVNRFKKQWHNKPKRCKECNETYKKNLAANPRPCVDFSMGACSYGDKCRFMHTEKPKLGVHFNQHESSDEEAYSPSDDESDGIDEECY